MRPHRPPQAKAPSAQSPAWEEAARLQKSWLNSSTGAGTSGLFLLLLYWARDVVHGPIHLFAEAAKVDHHPQVTALLLSSFLRTSRAP